MVRRVEAIFTKGAFLPVEPITLPEGTRVRLNVEDDATSSSIQAVGKIHTPKLAHPEDASDFAMEVREAGDAAL